MTKKQIIGNVSVFIANQRQNPQPPSARQLDELAEFVAAHSVIAGKVAELEALTWFGTDTRLSLDHYSPVYCDDGDQSVEWRVRRQSGSINDREWDVVGRGETPLAAIVEARAALAPYPERRHE